LETEGIKESDGSSFETTLAVLQVPGTWHNTLLLMTGPIESPRERHLVMAGGRQKIHAKSRIGPSTPSLHYINPFCDDDDHGEAATFVFLLLDIVDSSVGSIELCVLDP
jgi:hypothetical protein